MLVSVEESVRLELVGRARALLPYLSSRPDLLALVEADPAPGDGITKAESVASPGLLSRAEVRVKTECSTSPAL